MNAQTMNQDPFAQFRTTGGKQPGLIGRIIGLIIASGIMIVGFMFSLVALAIVAVLALVAGVWFWWKTRAIRRQLREQPASAFSTQPADDDGTIIEGEAVRENDTTDRSPRLLK